MTIMTIMTETHIQNIVMMPIMTKMTETHLNTHYSNDKNDKKTETHIYNAHYNNENNDIHHRSTVQPHIIMMTIMTIISETHIHNASKL